MAAEEVTPEGDGMADWAEALTEQKSAADGGVEMASGGVLSGEASRPFSSASDSDIPINDINRVLDIPVQLSVELGRTKVPIKHILSPWTCSSMVI